MPRTPRSHAAPPALVAVALALAAGPIGCSTGGGAAPGGPLPIDPGRPGDLQFAAGLARYDAAVAAATSGFSAQAAGDAATAAARFAEAVVAYGEARAAFDVLLQDAGLCPAVSIRCDRAAYLGGRSSYQIGTHLNDQAAFADARARLDAMLAAYPASPWGADAAYFAGRARFQLVTAFGVGTYADAEPLFEASLRMASAGTFADNALYYDGRCEFEQGLALVTPLAPAAGSLAFTQARGYFEQAIAALEPLPGRYPASTYRDNAAYYLGRAWYEKPCDAASAAGDAERLQNLAAAIAAFGPVVADAASLYHPGARYWRGRAAYARASHAGAPATDLADALADFHAVAAFTTSIWRDNALAYAVRSQVRQGACAAACADLGTLRREYPASSYTASAEAYYSTNGCPTCP